jgi:primase-polymerase (primpol)-like protein
MDNIARPPRPVALRVSEANIPEALKLLRQWVVWKYKFRAAKWTKPPFRVDRNGYAKSTDPTTWSEYETALSAYRKGGFDGIGFVLSIDAGIVGVDLDHCYDPQTESFEPSGVEGQTLATRLSVPRHSPKGFRS